MIISSSRNKIQTNKQTKKTKLNLKVFLPDNVLVVKCCLGGDNVLKNSSPSVVVNLIVIL